MNEKELNWMKTLKVGDEVAYVQKTMRGVMWRTAIIEKVTPSGRLNLPFGYVIKPDGTFRGDAHRRIYPVTEEVKASIAKVQLVERIKKQLNTVDLENASVEQLTDIYESLKTFPVKMTN